MQGQRGTIGSLPETLDFDIGSSSSSSAMDQPGCWNNVPENRLPECLLSPNGMNNVFSNSMGGERQGLSWWCSNGASSSNTQIETANEDRSLELGWLPSSTSSVPARIVLPDNSSSTLMFPQAPDSNSIQIQPRLNLGLVGHSASSSQSVELPNSFKFSGSENNHNRLATSSDPSTHPARSLGFMEHPASSFGFVEGEINGRHAPMDRQISCKRKTMEGNIGPSSSSGSCSHFQHMDSTARPGIPVRNITRNGLSIQGAPMLGLAFPDPNVLENPESSTRNLRMRTTSSTQPNFVNPSSVLPSGRVARRPGVVLQSQPSMGHLPVDNRLDNVSGQTQPAVVQAPPMLQNLQSVRLSGAAASSSSSLRNNGLSSSIAFGDRDALREELNSGSTARAIPVIPLPATELRNFVRHPVSRSAASRSANIQGSVANSPPGPVWPPHLNPPPQYHRRLSEYLRQSLLSSAGAVGPGLVGSFTPIRPGHPGVSQEIRAPGHHPPHPRMVPWLENHSIDGLGLHYSMRTLGAGGERSGRLVSELRNVIGLIRRGEPLRFEDVMLLDPLVFAGMADLHDRHRDMRLDVDNMSYEELLALEERIGNVSIGVTEEVISKQLKQKKYAVATKPESEIEPCCVCQEDYVEGDDMGTLDCGHEFHKDCIKQWLTRKNICPICKTTALQS